MYMYMYLYRYRYMYIYIYCASAASCLHGLDLNPVELSSKPLLSIAKLPSGYYVRCSQHLNRLYHLRIYKGPVSSVSVSGNLWGQAKFFLPELNGAWPVFVRFSMVLQSFGLQLSHLQVLKLEMTWSKYNMFLDCRIRMNDCISRSIFVTSPRLKSKVLFACECCSGSAESVVRQNHVRFLALKTWTTEIHRFRLLLRTFIRAETRQNPGLNEGRQCTIERWQVESCTHLAVFELHSPLALVRWFYK